MPHPPPVAAQKNERVVGHWRVTPDLVRHAEFYFSHPTISSQLPYTNARNGMVLNDLTFSCDKCGIDLPVDRARGIINSYPRHTEVRWVGDCDSCARVLHNSYRITQDFRIQFQRDGRWYITKPIAWWRLAWSRLVGRLLSRDRL